MGKPTGYLVEVQGVGSVPLCVTTGKGEPWLYAAYQTDDGPGRVDFPRFIDNAEDLRDMGYATIKARKAKAGKRPTDNPGKAPQKKAEKAPDNPAPEAPKKKGGLHGLLGQ